MSAASGAVSDTLERRSSALLGYGEGIAERNVG
jgi:hypothetical protein